MLVRRATLVDVPSIYAVGHSAWHDTYPELAPTDYVEAALVHDWSVERLTSAIPATDIILLVAEEIDQVIGTAQTQLLNQHEAVLWHCYVRQAYRRRGIGKLLLTATLWVLPPGIESYFTFFLSTNTQAAGFYTAQGFVFERTETKPFNGALLAYTWLKRSLGTTAPASAKLPNR